MKLNGVFSDNGSALPLPLAGVRGERKLALEVGVGVFPQNTLPEWIDFPPPAAL
jgi:hypothetical protein